MYWILVQIGNHIRYTINGCLYWHSVILTTGMPWLHIHSIKIKLEICVRNNPSLVLTLSVHVNEKTIKLKCANYSGMRFLYKKRTWSNNCFTAVVWCWLQRVWATDGVSLWLLDAKCFMRDLDRTKYRYEWKRYIL